MNRDEMLEGFGKFATESQNSFDIFAAGVRWAEYVQKRERILKEKRRNREFIPTDFIGNEKPNMPHTRTVLYEDRFAVYTQGNYLVKARYDYPPEQEGMKLDKKGNAPEDDFDYPNYKRAIPDINDLAESADFTCNDVRLNMPSSKSADKLSRELVDLGAIKVSGIIASRMAKFWGCFPGARLYRHKEDIHKSWMLMDGDNLFVFMPLNLK